MEGTKREGVAPGLSRSLGFPGVLGQSIAGEAPTATPAVNVALVFLAVGSGTWLVYALATLAILLVSLNIAPLAKATSGAGSLADFVGHGLGRTGKIFTGWILLFTYLSTGVAVLVACVGYLASLLQSAGAVVPEVWLVAIVGAAASLLALRNVRFSTGAMLAIESLSILLVLLLCTAILVRLGFKADLSQFRLEGLSFSGVNGALLIGILSFAGFETAAALGDEAKDPLRSIPRALFATPAITGLFFVFTSYVLVLGFNHFSIDVAGSDTPLDILADRVQRPELGILISFGATISLFGCTIATLVAASRAFFSLASQGALPAQLTRVSPRSLIPGRAMWMSIIVVIATGMIFATYAKPMVIYDWLGSFATFGFVSAYLLTCLSSAIVLRRTGRLDVRGGLVSGAAILVLLCVLVASIYPPPAAPLNLLPWLFATLVIIGSIASLVRWRTPN
jgi:amino acid transporter